VYDVLFPVSIPTERSEESLFEALRCFAFAQHDKKLTLQSLKKRDLHYVFISNCVTPNRNLVQVVARWRPAWGKHGEPVRMMCSIRSIVWVVVKAIVLGAAIASALATAAPGTVVIPGRRSPQSPVVDGMLSPGEWENAVEITTFWDYKQQHQAQLPTRCLLAYTSEGIYAAFDCYDPEPDKILAQEIRRGADLTKDDYVELAIWPTGVNVEPYSFRVNARGTQDESIPGGSISNIRWRGDWKAAVSRHSSGWSAEIFVPFRILRIPRGQKELGVLLLRNLPRLNLQYVYPNTGTTIDLLKRAKWTDLQLPEVLPPPVILPYTQLDTASGRTEWRSGLDIKWQMSGGLTSLLTLNPDFKNVAREVDSVSFSYVPRLVRETRPFFVEGDGFFPDTTMFYSGNVQAVDAALKSFGTLGRWSYGALLSRGADQRATVGRLAYQMTTRSHAEVQFVRDDRPGVNATAVGGGAMFYPSFPDGFANISVLYFRTSGQKMPVGEKIGLILWRQRGDGRMSFGGQVYQISRGFSPTLGYAPDVGLRGYDSMAIYNKRWDNRPVQLMDAGIVRNQRWKLDGGVYDDTLSGWVSVTLRNDMVYWLSANRYHRPPYHDRTISAMVGWNARRLYNAGDVVITAGKVAGGDSLYWRFLQGVPFTERLRLMLHYEQSRIRYRDPNTPDRNLHQFIATLNYDIDPEHSIGGRYIGRGSGFGRFHEVNTLYLTYRQQVRRGTDIFLIFGDPNASSTQTRFAVKVMTPW
jgi:hypothetical protein